MSERFVYSKKIFENKFKFYFKLLGKLDKKKFVDVYRQFYPHGKADKFCGLKTKKKFL